MNPKHWSPREARTRAEMKRLSEIYLPSAFRDRCKEGTVGDLKHFELDDGTVFEGKLVMIIGSLFPSVIWLLEDGRMAVNRYSLREIQADWKKIGSGRPWGEGFELVVYP